MIARSQLQRLLLPIRRFCIRLHRSDKGSGTVVGVALVMVAATLVSVMSGAGHVAVRHAQARSAADLAAFSAALPGETAGVIRVRWREPWLRGITPAWCHAIWKESIWAMWR